VGLEYLRLGCHVVLELVDIELEELGLLVEGVDLAIAGDAVEEYLSDRKSVV